ncbi:hypothetical protein KKG31_04975 [Patescibacteria group bacterium]|nr:hypothetical protein [Patescibacteria group bacterium]MBU1758476.1 hypothetical protein [Patescibacteria group bacterium]
MVVKLLSVQFVMTRSPDINHVTVSEKSTVMVNHVFVYQDASHVSITVGAILSIQFTVAVTIPVEISQESSKSNVPLVLKTYVSLHPLFVITTPDSSKAPITAVTSPLVKVGQSGVYIIVPHAHNTILEKPEINKFPIRK